jgi:hypothetical protein
MAIPPRVVTRNPAANTRRWPPGAHLACCALMAKGVTGVASSLPMVSRRWTKIRYERDSAKGRLDSKVTNAPSGDHQGVRP